MYPDLTEYDPAGSWSQTCRSGGLVELGIMSLIFSSYWGKCSQTFSRSHSLVRWSIRSTTLKFWFSKVGGPIGASEPKGESQWSDQTLMLSPFPTKNPIPLFSTALPANILDQPWEEPAFLLLSIKEQSLKYLPFSTCANRESGLFRILQLSFANRESL